MRKSNKREEAIDSIIEVGDEIFGNLKEIEKLLIALDSKEATKFSIGTKLIYEALSAIYEESEQE